MEVENALYLKGTSNYYWEDSFFRFIMAGKEIATLWCPYVLMIIASIARSASRSWKVVSAHRARAGIGSPWEGPMGLRRYQRRRVSRTGPNTSTKNMGNWVGFWGELLEQFTCSQNLTTSRFGIKWWDPTSSWVLTSKYGGKGRDRFS